MAFKQETQLDSQGHWRRWYSNSRFDVILWFTDRRSLFINGFQICLKHRSERETVLFWEDGKTIQVAGTGKVDLGEQSPHANLAPLIETVTLEIDYASLLSELREHQPELGLSDDEYTFLEMKIVEHRTRSRKEER